MKQRLLLIKMTVCYRLFQNQAVIGDRCGDRLMTTCHRSESTMNKGFGDAGDRLKEDFHFYV